MGKVDCFEIGGLELLFHSDDHLPAHFHAKKTEHWEIRVSILETTEDSLMFDSVWPQGLDYVPRRIRRILGRLVVENREALLSEWEQKVFSK